MEIDTTTTAVSEAYDRTRRNVEIVRKRVGHPLTLAEKILFGHLYDPEGQPLEPGRAILRLNVDRVAMQDATAQMAILQFAQGGFPRTAVRISLCSGLRDGTPSTRRSCRRTSSPWLCESPSTCSTMHGVWIAQYGM